MIPFFVEQINIGNIQFKSKCEKYELKFFPEDKETFEKLKEQLDIGYMAIFPIFKGDEKAKIEIYTKENENEYRLLEERFRGTKDNVKI